MRVCVVYVWCTWCVSVCAFVCVCVSVSVCVVISVVFGSAWL